MNRSMIIYVLGTVLKLTGIFLFIPVICSLIYHEQEGLPFFVTGLCSVGLGTLATLHKPENTVFFLREGCIATALSWILLSIVGAVPFFLTGEIPSFLDALFETVSGFTTTGASILPDVEAMSKTALLWRSFTHWIGGMGVLVFLLAIIPMTGGGTINLMRAESPGPSVGKLVPKIRYTARILYGIYMVLTVSMLIILIISGMPVFDSICTSLGTAGTGGFGVKSDSVASYSGILQWIVTIFMILFGINFNGYYLLLQKEWKKALSMEEIRAYLLIIVSATAIITVNVADRFSSIGDALTAAAFQVGSIITTTGFSTVDFDKWPDLSRGILVLLMFIGACAGSTGGGIKVSRILFLFKNTRHQIFAYLHPKSVRPIKMDGHTSDNETIMGIQSFFAAYLLIFVCSIFPLLACGSDLITSFTAVAATINNIGPGLGAVGPMNNFADLNCISKIVLIFDMLAGRLELFPLLVLFSPAIWNEFKK